MQKTEYIWVDGKLVRWDDAKVHILAHTLHYGLGVFEGIRVYRTVQGKPGIFCLSEHISRLLDSAKAVGIQVRWSKKELEEAVCEVVRANRVEEGYIRPIIFLGAGEMGLFPQDVPVITAIAVWPWGTYLGEDGLKNGVRAKISSYSRPYVNSLLVKAKVCGHYVNSILAKVEAKKLGFDEAILLDTEGYVAEGAGENIFIVKDGVVKTPPVTSVLNGITRRMVMLFLNEMQIPVREEKFTRDELYTADEAFFTGTAAEITPIREVDWRPIGDGSWPITRKVQQKFFKVVRGEDENYLRFITFVD